jgi:hypothetical protein
LRQSAHKSAHDLFRQVTITNRLDEPSLILDYASPRKRVRLRMPAKSRIDVICEPGQVDVIETLKGKGQAIGGIVFACFVLLVMLKLILTERHGTVWVLGPFWFAEAGVLVLVIHQTWRKTLLSVTAERVQLKFTSPLTSKSYEWPAIDVADVQAVVTANPNSFNPLAELRMRMASGGEVHLFTDHPAREIQELAVAIDRVLEPEPTDG